MKKFIAVFLLTLIVASTSFAQDARVWFTSLPDNASETLKAGDDILLYAKLGNTTKDAITYTVLFKTADKTIATKAATVSGFTEQSISVPWKMPEMNTLVTAEVTKAVGVDKKSIAALVGPIGSVTVTNVKQIELPDTSRVKQFINTLVAHLETFRLKQLQYFTKLKAEADVVLERTTVKDVANLLQPETPGSTESETLTEDKGNFVGYAKLAYASIGKAFFGHRGVYFVTVILLTLLVIRFIFNRFFS